MPQPREYKYDVCRVCYDRCTEPVNCTTCGKAICDGCAFDCRDCKDVFCRSHIIEIPLHEFGSDYRCTKCFWKTQPSLDVVAIAKAVLGMAAHC